MRRILVLFSVASLGARGALAEPRALTLAEAVEMARHNAVSVVRAEGTSENAAQGVRTARGALLPTLSLSTGSTRQYVPAAVPWSSNLALTTNLLLFDGGRRFFDLHQARATRASADVDEGLARWQAVLAAKQAFFDVLAARETQVAAAAQLEQADRQRWVAVERTRAKAATRSDSLRAEIDVRSAQLEVLVAATDRASADAALARAIGSLDPVTAAAADTTDPGLALDESALIPLVENAPLVQSARSHLDADREAEKGSWTAYLPSLSASWTHSGNGTVGPGEWGANSLDYTGALRLWLARAG